MRFALFIRSSPAGPILISHRFGFHPNLQYRRKVNRASRSTEDADGGRFLWTSEANGSERAGKARRPRCPLREIRQRHAGSRAHTLEGRPGKARVRECLAGSLENVDRALENAHERIPPESPGPSVPENHGRADGAVFLR